MRCLNMIEIFYIEVLPCSNDTLTTGILRRFSLGNSGLQSLTLGRVNLVASSRFSNPPIQNYDREPERYYKRGNQ